MKKLVNNGIVNHLEKCGIARAFKRAKATRAVGLDIFRVSDRVWHAGLLHKLSLHVRRFRSDIWPYFLFSSYFLCSPVPNNRGGGVLIKRGGV